MSAWDWFVLLWPLWLTFGAIGADAFMFHQRSTDTERVTS